jgi:hypothetical protein
MAGRKFNLIFFLSFFLVLYVDITPYSEVLLSDFTIRYDSLEGSSTYPRGGNGDTDTQHPDFFDQLKRWTLVFLDDHRHCVSTLIHYRKMTWNH